MEDYLEPGEINFRNLIRESTESSVKNEELKDDYDLSLLAQLDDITYNLASDTNDLPMVRDLELPSPISETSNNSLQNGMSNFKENDLPDLQFSPNKEPSNVHYVKYKLQDGRHVKIWECGICKKVFAHQYTLMRHLPTHTDERKYKCVTCGKAFRQMSTLSQHRAIHSTERPYICEVCKKTFNRVSTLISHRKTHTGIKPHRCHLCTKAFHQKGNLRNHIFTHTNARPYKCDICEKGFNQMSNLMCHKLKTHQRIEKPNYTCQICGKCFTKRCVLREHEQNSHKIINSSQFLSSDDQLIDQSNNPNAVIIDPIKTEAMRCAIESNQTPYALLRPVGGIPVLVRVLPAGDKQMLVPALAEDLKKHSHISITSKSDTPANENGKPLGETVKIQIPVVATVIQQNVPAGEISKPVVNPGPSRELDNEVGTKKFNFNTSPTLTNSNSTTGEQNNQEISLQNTPIMTEGFPLTENIQNINIRFDDAYSSKIGDEFNYVDLL
ncbi:zinc finger protein 836-like [Diorhabda carinulata]|uniref:zinc finger protein 836-like n=1 Tax=Diorhabda carinulata TaxID=1163345 RepID=UPI0025A110BB|nr:zinc finger protein 836-like [Diorhabda carinulata]